MVATPLVYLSKDVQILRLNGKFGVESDTDASLLSILSKVHYIIQKYRKKVF